MTFRINNKIAGAVMRDVRVERGQSFTTDESVVELAVKSSQDSNSTTVVVLSKKAALDLAKILDTIL